MVKPGRKPPRYQRKAEYQFRVDGARARDQSVRLGTRLKDGRILADLGRQAPDDSDDSKLYYEDYEYDCQVCGRPQVWTAERQKWWYEVAKGPIYSLATRCRDYRTARRLAHRGTPRRSHADRRRGGSTAGAKG